MLLMFANICVKRSIRILILVADTKNQNKSSLNKGKVCFSLIYSLGVSSSGPKQQHDSVRDLDPFYLVALSFSTHSLLLWSKMAAPTFTIMPTVLQ